MKNLTLPLVALTLSACAITVRTPVNRLESPEVSPVGTFSADAGLVGVHETVVVPDTTAVPPVTPRRTIDDGGSLKLGIDYSAIDRFELAAKIYLSGTPGLQAKYQLLDGQVPLSLVAGYGYSNSTRSDTGISLIGLQNVSAKSETTIQIIDVGGLVGYRASEPCLIYAGFFQTWAPYSGEISQTVNSGATTIYTFSGQVQQQSYHLGLKLGSGKSGVLLEIAHGTTDDSGTRHTRFQFGAGGRFAFN